MKNLINLFISCEEKRHYYISQRKEIENVRIILPEKRMRESWEWREKEHIKEFFRKAIQKIAFLYEMEIINEKYFQRTLRENPESSLCKFQPFIIFQSPCIHEIEWNFGPWFTPGLWNRGMISLASACNVTCLLCATLVSLWGSKQKQHAHKNITMRPWKVLVGGKIHFKLDGQTAYFFSFKGK